MPIYYFNSNHFSWSSGEKNVRPEIALHTVLNHHLIKLFFDPLERALEANLFNPHKGRVKVFPGQLGDKAGVMGVARLAAD